MEDYSKKDFGKILKHNALEARREMRATDSDAMRIYDRNLGAFPVTVELYGKCAKIVDYSEDGMNDEDTETCIDIVNRMAYVERDRICFQRRKKRENGEQHEATGEEKAPMVVKESGLEFEVDLKSHVDSGLFLDMAGARRMIREMSMGERVLNLFSYTGSFSVYAAAGGAESVVSVDLNNGYSKIARENLGRNGFLSEEKYPTIVYDATKFVDEEIKKGNKYDIIIFDPPSFSNSHKMDTPFDVRKDYQVWLGKLNSLLPFGGTILFSSNLFGFDVDKNKLKKWFKVTEVTEDVRAFGFTKGKNGQSRIWIFEKVADYNGGLNYLGYKGSRDEDGRDDMKEAEDGDIERLVLTMEADEKEVEEKRKERREKREREEGEKRSFERRDGRPSDRRDFGPRRERRDYGDRDHDRGYERRDRGYDRPRDGYQERRDRGFYGDRDRDYGRDRGYDRPRRDYGGYSERRDYGDRDRDRGRSYERRDGGYGRDRGYDRPRDGYRDRDRDFRGDRGYGRRYDRDDRGYSSYHRDRPDGKFEGKPRADRYKQKPYGYDSFRPSRKRDDSNEEDSTFFWKNKDEEKNKD